MDSRNHPQRQPQPHHDDHQSLPESHELEQPVSDMVHVIVSFNQHEQLNLRQNPISSVSALTPVVNQADSIAIAPVLSENLVKKSRERPPGSEKKKQPETSDSGAPASETPAKKARGRPPCSGKKKQPETSGTIGISSVNHIIHVDIGEA
ncbi:AT-hook motif nuclear-localized protein 13-like [Capsicum annuum]|uniref:AT-hook motif nuclear-localized protein 13-like n=1 Tax=Capsicum annuum TaxID=4072 RepID=UPI001FB0E57B|nr:AT-hook motif nuclear-localized protein 13-like [Capsicum annuum]